MIKFTSQLFHPICEYRLTHTAIRARFQYTQNSYSVISFFPSYSRQWGLLGLTLGRCISHYLLFAKGFLLDLKSHVAKQTSSFILGLHHSVATLDHVLERMAELCSCSILSKPIQEPNVGFFLPTKSHLLSYLWERASHCNPVISHHSQRVWHIILRGFLQTVCDVYFKWMNSWLGNLQVGLVSGVDLDVMDDYQEFYTWVKECVTDTFWSQGWQVNCTTMT
jgi:hypothetical protein